MNFVVIDTEGKNILREIAIINEQGELIYEAFALEEIESNNIRLNVKPLTEILRDFSHLTQDKLMVFHSANHDLKILKNSYQQVGLTWKPLQSTCTFLLAQQYYPDLQSYSLEYLSRKLNLKVNNRYFNPNQAHAARYDAAFTYQLYQDIQQTRVMNLPQTSVNPFSSNRVDTPFQDHIDYTTLYQTEFNDIQSILTAIKADPNHQSQGVIIIGEAGSGKTHLIMRLAKALLKINRLLFIRHPNNPDTILHHIYSRILESFVQEVPGTGYTQLEHLIAHSFVKLISQSNFIRLTQKDRDIQAITQNNPLDLYQKLGKEDSQKKRDYWQHIDKRASEWWMNEYSMGGYSSQIIKGIIKFCSYSRRKEKSLVSRWLAAEELSQEDMNTIGLSPWDEGMSQEDFSLEAISVFSKLSLLDEPLIIVFDQLESLGLKQKETLLLSFGEAVKEIFTHVPNSLIILNLFPDRWQQFQSLFDSSIIDRVSQHQVVLNTPSKEQLLSILTLKSKQVDLDLNQIFAAQELAEILQGKSIRSVINNAAKLFRQKTKKSSPDKANDSKIETEELTLLNRLEKVEKDVTQLHELLQAIGETIVKFASPSLSSPPPAIVNEEIKQYLQETRQLLEQDYQELQIITDADDIGKLITIAEAFKTLYSLEIDHLRLGKRKLPEHLLIQTTQQSRVIAFLQVDGSGFTSRIKNFNELVITYKNHQFQLWRDQRKSMITGKIGCENITMLDNAANGEFCVMEQEERLDFELIYKLITDIYNKDLELTIKEALTFISLEMKESWLIKLFQ
ncbi:MAG: exonuclease domain-containing protein [Microcystaceae cyanobacterium]